MLFYFQTFIFRSKSASGLLAQLNNKLELSVPDKNTNSFHLFLRLLGKNLGVFSFSNYTFLIRSFQIGRGLRKWNDNPRFWNQLKGRIYSKFSISKLLSLNEMGLYHFISLFLTLALTTDLHEVVKCLFSF